METPKGKNTKEQQREFLDFKLLYANDEEKRNMEFNRILDPDCALIGKREFYHKAAQRLDCILSQSNDKMNLDFVKNVLLGHLLNLHMYSFVMTTEYVRNHGLGSSVVKIVESVIFMVLIWLNLMLQLCIVMK